MYACVYSIVYLEPVLNKDKTQDIADNLNTEEWELAFMIVEVLEPFMRAQEYLEGEGYVTASLVIPTVYRLRQWLYKLRADASNAGTAVSSRILACLETLIPDFNKRWGDGKPETRNPTPLTVDPRP